MYSNVYKLAVDETTGDLNERMGVETYNKRLIKDAQARGFKRISELCLWRVIIKKELRKKGDPFGVEDETTELEKKYIKCGCGKNFKKVVDEYNKRIKEAI